MLLQEPAHSPYDVRFQLFGFQVRITWSFWLAGLVFGFSLARLLDEYVFGPVSPGLLLLLVLWTLCLLVSILIHELGHAFAFRKYGFDSKIVLYHFGGLAIPTGATSGRSAGDLTPKQDIVVSLAGPLAQISSAIVVIGAVKAAGYRLAARASVGNWEFEILPEPFGKIPGLLTGDQIDSPGLFALVTFYIFPSVVWALLNLVPVWPLDGGHVMRSIVHLRGGNMVQALWISVIAAALMAAYGFTNDQKYMGFLFLILGVTNFQVIQQMSSRGY